MVKSFKDLNFGAHDTIEDALNDLNTSIGNNTSSLAENASKVNSSKIPLDYFKTPTNTWDDALTSAFSYFGTKGGEITLGANIYTLSPFTIPPRITISGMGKSVSILKQLNGTIGNFITFNTNSLFSVLKDLTIDGNKANCPSGADGILFNTKSNEGFNPSEITDNTIVTPSTYTYNTIQNIIIANTKSHGLEINSAYWGTFFKNIFTYACDGNGIYNKTTDIFFDTIQAEQSGLSGIVENAGNNRWNNLKSIWNGRLDTVNSAGFKLNNCARSMIVNVECQDNYCDGVQFVNSNGFIIENLLVDGNGRIYGQSDPTDGSFAGNINNTGLRVTNSQLFRVKGIASNYKYPNCYLQYNAAVVDSSSNSYVIDIVEINQPNTSPTVKNSPGSMKIFYGMPNGTTYLAKPITDFQINTVSAQRVADTSSSPTGDTTGGTVITYRFDEDSYSYQEYVPHSRNVKYMRYWNSGSWGVWSIVTPQATIIGGGDDGTILTQPLSYFTKDTITFKRINGGNVNAPNSSGGVLITYCLNQDSTFSYQEFKIYNTGAKYVRQWNGSAWTAWSPVSIGSGTTANRPTTGLYVGMNYFDTTLNKPIWYKGSSVWVDSTGATV